MTFHFLIVEFTTWFILGYFILLNGSYLMLNMLSIIPLRRLGHEKILNDLPQVFSELELPISILVPAFNEETTIVASLQSLLQLSYSKFEIIVINDGSDDGTLEALRLEFGVVPFPQAYRIQLATAPVRGIFYSPRHPGLRVIDKENGGKADALNAGINASRYPLFCGVDADSILQRDSLRQVIKPFLRDPRMVATGGTVRIANGCEVKDGFLTKIGLPKNFWALFQVVEYLRAFLFGRMGWSAIDGMLIISGAFGLFRKDTVIMVGGYRPETIGEDMELVVRLHRVLREKRIPYRIEFMASPICWTEAPEDRTTLRNQRIRWQRGLSESLAANWRLMFSRNGGVPGWLAFPFMVLFEWLGPLVELGGYVFMIVAFFAGWISMQAFVIFLFAAIGLGILLSASSLLLEEISYHLYPRGRQMALLLAVVVLENFGYRQLTCYWRLLGLCLWAIEGRAKWGVMRRKGAVERLG